MSNFIELEEMIVANDRILVKIPAKEEKIGSIILSENSIAKEQSASSCGILVKVGSRVFKDLLEEEVPSIGDIIYFSPFCGVPLYDEKEKDLKTHEKTIYRNMLWDDIIGFSRIKNSNNK